MCFLDLYNILSNIKVLQHIYISCIQILSLVLSRSDIAFHRETMKNVQIDKISTTILDNKETSYFGFLTSQSICIFMCSSPLVGFIFLSLLHNLMLSFEQVGICKYIFRKKFYLAILILQFLNDDIKNELIFYFSF